MQQWNEIKYEINNEITPSVQSWSMALMMRSHSSARVRQPHSPSRGTYRSSFCSSSTSGTLIPSSSGNVAAQEEETEVKTTGRIQGVSQIASFCTKYFSHILSAQVHKVCSYWEMCTIHTLNKVQKLSTEQWTLYTLNERHFGDVAEVLECYLTLVWVGYSSDNNDVLGI